MIIRMKTKMTLSIASDLLKIFQSSVSAVLPENLIRSSVKFNAVNEQFSIAGESYSLKNKNLYLIGTGKAVQSMAIEVERILSSKISHGIISIPEGSHFHAMNKNLLYFEGAQNNMPDKNSEKTARKIKDLVTKLGKDDFLLVLISGGGSALLSLPKEPISLEEKTKLIKKLANSGADIKEINTVRKRLSDLKGGKLAIKAQPANVVALILSDIVGDPLDLIASGPTVENEDSPSAAINIINKYKLLDNLPKSIETALNDPRDFIEFPRENVKNYIIGSNKRSIAAALIKAKELNYIPIQVSSTVTGNVKLVAREYTKLTKAFCEFSTGKLDQDSVKAIIRSLNIPGLVETIIDVYENVKGKDLCLILGGEITVEVQGTGVGGRNQQLALEFSNYINEMKEEFINFDVYLLSAGTDGIDGPTNAAGAIGYLNLINDSIQENMDVKKYIQNNDCYSFYKDFKNGDLHVITGHTNTNVMDIHLIIIKRL